MRKLGISKKEFAVLDQRTPKSDPVAERSGAPIYTGSHDEIEERAFPWLRRRRRYRSR